MSGLNVVNLVATTRLGESFDLDQVADDLNIDFEPDQFPGMAYRITTPKVCVLLFRSGRAVATGAKSIADAESAFTQVHEALETNGFTPWVTYDVITSNIVVTHDVGRPLNLAHLTLSLPMARTEWEPEQFPGLIFRLSSPKSVCLIFSSGKCVITGNRSLDDAQDAVNALEDELNAVR